MENGKNIFRNYGNLIFLLLFMLQYSCKKYLDVKPENNVAVPNSLNELQALLDNYQVMNHNSPKLLDCLTDDFYVTTSDYNSLSGVNAADVKMNYIWDKDANAYIDNWLPPYQNPIYYSNVVLDQLTKINDGQNENDFYNSIKGSALFFRSFAFLQLAQLYCKPYSSTANADLGIVLRLTSDISVPSVRSSVQQTYDQIINDLKSAARLLPQNSIAPTRPNKAAAYGALARTYLSMRDYSQALQYADSCLQIYNSLIDYNTLIPISNPPFSTFNKETIFYNIIQSPSISRPPRGRIDSTLYQSYNADDLRRDLYFKANGDGTFGFQGSYSGNISTFLPFDGIATDEMYLIRAECHARSGNTSLALQDLNTLMQKRWRAAGWVPFTAINANDALNKILVERRKELFFRGLRWSDLRRLNLEGANITLRRFVNGVTYTLPPNDFRWVLLIPTEVINFTGIAQNPR